MNYKLGLFFLVVLCCLISMTIVLLLRKQKKEIIQNAFYVSTFFLFLNCFILSAMKYHLGYHTENLFESFWDAQAVTIWHYGVPLLIINLTVSAAVYIFFCKEDIQMIRFFDSSMFLITAFMFFMVRKINNKVYCITFLTACSLTVLLFVFMRKKQIAFASDNMRKRAGQAVPVLVYWTVTVVIYIPNELYLNNATDFPISFWPFLAKMLIGGAVAFVILLLGMLLYLTDRQFDILLVCMFAFITIGYIQGNFLNGSMGVLDGVAKIWGAAKIATNLIVWILLGGGMVFFFVAKKEKAVRWIRVLSIWVILIQVVSLGVLIITSENTAPKSEATLTTDGMLRIGRQNNIIVFVLDMFDGRTMDHIQEQDAEFLSALKDFTYYDNASSVFCPTHNSIPFLLTGTEYDENNKEGYITYAFGRHNLLNDMDEAGYRIGLYTDTQYVSEQVKDIVSNFGEDIHRTCSISDVFSLMTQCSRYKMSPFIAKNYYLYDTGDIAQLVVDERIVNIDNDIPFYNKLAQEGLSMEENGQDNSFLFYHMHGAHPPYTMTEEFQYLAYDAKRMEIVYNHKGTELSQARGAMKIVFEYIRQLQELGKYEDALIIITSDHGRAKIEEDIPFPILFVKAPNESRDSMATSSAPVSHADVIEQIKGVLRNEEDCQKLDDIGEDEQRIRYLYYTAEPNGDVFDKYEIRGNVRERRNAQYLYSVGQ